MEYRIKPNPKHESYTQTAIVQNIAGWGVDRFTIMVTDEDRIDPDGPIELDNFRVPSHYRLIVDEIFYTYPPYGEDDGMTIFRRTIPVMSLPEEPNAA